jgi:glycine cleavage system H protein
MKELDELNLPDNIRYAEDHEWALLTGDTVRIGVSDYAQDQLGDIVYVETPQVGAALAKGEEFGSLESVKAVSELYMPMSGELVAVNEALADAPEAINEDPYGSWIIEIRPADRDEYEGLMTSEGYLAMLKG